MRGRKFVKVRVRRTKSGRFGRAYDATRTPSGAISRAKGRSKRAKR